MRVHLKLGITFKVFLAILGTCVIVITAMAAAVRISFERGFLDYLNTEDINRAGQFTVTLAINYRQHGDWEWLRNNSHQWLRLIMERFSSPFHGEDSELPLEVTQNQPPPDKLTLVPRLTLNDARDRFVAGNPFPALDVVRKPVIVQGATVGWLLISPNKVLTDTVAVNFQEQERKAVLVIGGMMVLMAMLVAVLLSRNLLSPVKQLARSTRALTAGDYSQRMAPASRDELGQLAEDFNALANTLEKTDQARRQWIADISHELRTPLAVLRGEIEAMQDGVQPLCTSGMKSLHMEVMMLNQLVNDLYELTMSDIGALNYRKERVDLLDVVRQTASSFQEEFRRRDLALDSRLDGAPPAYVFADEMRLAQLFTNLLQNSLRYTDSGGRTQITAERKPGKVIVDLHDTAPGVPPEALPHLFERLFRVESSRSRASGGAGLGLSICKNIVEAHSGTIEAQPSPLGGLWLRVSLPLDA